MSAPAALVATRLSLHAVAEQVVKALRVQATGNEIALQTRPVGFGTPDLPGGGWVGVSGVDVIRVAADETVAREPLTSLRQAASFVGLETAAALPDEALTVDGVAAATLAAVWADGDVALRELVAVVGPSAKPSPVHLWPEHLDIAIDAGDDAPGMRATFGVSPGDGEHDAPYAYVAPWTPPAPGPFWNAVGFTGAERPAADPAATLEFFLACRAALAG